MIDHVQTGIYSSKAAAYIDANAAKLSAALDEVVSNLTDASSTGNAPFPLSGSIAQQLSKLNQKLHRLDSDRIIERAKQEVGKRPITFTFCGAVAGAIVAQFALIVVRGERLPTIDAVIENGA